MQTMTIILNVSTSRTRYVIFRGWSLWWILGGALHDEWPPVRETMPREFASPIRRANNTCHAGRDTQVVGEDMLYILPHTMRLMGGPPLASRTRWELHSGTSREKFPLLAYFFFFSS